MQVFKILAIIGDSLNRYTGGGSQGVLDQAGLSGSGSFSPDAALRAVSQIQARAVSA